MTAIGDWTWVRKGLIFRAAGEGGWMKSHAQVPTVLVMDDRLRVYFSSRPEAGLSLTTFVDLDIDEPARVIALNEAPILELGLPGTFDEHGIMPSAVVEADSEVRLYYSGWSRSIGVPYINSTGLAISRDGGTTFEKFSQGPILGRDRLNPYSATSPFVMKDGGEWRMWFCSGTGWLPFDGKLEHVYDIKQATSEDGFDWRVEASVAISQTSPEEALTRPTVIRDADGYHMWYCYRGSQDFRDGAQAYRIGYARSPEGVEWRRADGDAGVMPSSDGWDGNMQAYPNVVQAKDRWLMFYNGDGFGAAGFGYAVRET